MADNKYRYSYSGADVRVSAYFEGAEDLVVPIESTHTIAYSIHEAKGDVRAFGFRGIKGLTRGIRTVAGSMIFTVIEDHPLRELQSVYGICARERNMFRHMGWSIDRDEVGVGSAYGSVFGDFENRIAPALPPSCWQLQFVSEMGAYEPVPDFETANLPANIPGAGLLLRNVEFIDEGQVTSVSDMVTEITYSFKAWDVKPLSKQRYTGEIILPTANRMRNAEAEIYNAVMSGQNDIYKRITGSDLLIKSGKAK